jgi:hypothetical protein
MGKLVLKLYAAADCPPQAGRLLQQLRRLKATLVRSTVEGTGTDAAEIFEFTTAGFARARPTQRSPHLIRPIIEQQERVTHLEIIAQFGRALAGPSLPHHIQKERSMPKIPRIRTLALGKFEPEGSQLFLLARRLVNGEGPPEELRMPNPVVTVVPNAHDEMPPRNAWGIAGIGVGLEMDRPYPPVEAIVVAGYILFGIDWPATFKKLHLPASLAHAYAALEQHFSSKQKDPDPVITIPKPISRRQITPPLVVADHRISQAALGPPERPQLTHQPDESTIDVPATRVR